MINKRQESDAISHHTQHRPTRNQQQQQQQQQPNLATFSPPKKKKKAENIYRIVSIANNNPVKGAVHQRVRHHLPQQLRRDAAGAVEGPGGAAPSRSFGFLAMDLEGLGSREARKVGSLHGLGGFGDGWIEEGEGSGFGGGENWGERVKGKR